jgi:LPS-assembly protein
VNTGFGPSWLRGNISYNSLSDEPTTGTPGSAEQVNISGFYRFRDYWRATGYHQHDLSEPGGSLLSGFGLSYEDECIMLFLGVQKNFTSDRDIEDSTDVIFRVKLRNLG